MDKETMHYYILKTTLLHDTNISNVTCYHFCSNILHMKIHDSGVRWWDVIIIIPNILFFIYLLLKINKAIILKKRSNLQVFAVLFSMVLASQLFSIIRCIISMAVQSDIYECVDRVMWLILRFFLLAIELSVVTFGFFFGHLDSNSSTKRVVLVTYSISLIYSLIQGFLEFFYDNEPFHGANDGRKCTSFGHGGMIFWFSSSFLLFMLYTIICLLPLTNLKEKYTFPAKRSFYAYCLILSLLNLAQGVGGVLLYNKIIFGMCVLDVTSYLYFTGFAPFVYMFFLYSFFNFSHEPSMLFSYPTQIEDDYDDYNFLHHGHSSGEFTNSMEQHSQSIFPDGVTNSSNFDQGVLSFSHNPLCPTLSSHPDLTLSTSVAFSQVPSKFNSGRDNKMKTFPA